MTNTDSNSQPIFRSRLVIDMQRQTSVQTLKIAMTNFRLAYSTSNSIEDKMLLAMSGETQAFAEFAMQSLFMSLSSLCEGLRNFDIATTPETLEAWDRGNTIFREMLMNRLIDHDHIEALEENSRR